MRLLPAGTCGLLLSLLLACGSPERGPSPGADDDDFIPARDLSLAELATRERPQGFTAVARELRPRAADRITADVVAGVLAPAAADALLLRLQLGRVQEVPEHYRADDAVLDVPDYAAYGVRMRLAGYAESEQAALRQLLAEYRGPDGTAADNGFLRRLLGPELAYAATSSPGSGSAGVAAAWTEVVATDPSESGKVGAAQATAEAAWPQIAAFMEVTSAELGLDDVVRFSEPLGPGAQAFVNESGADPAASATITGRLGDKWIVEFGPGEVAAVRDTELELLDPARAPVRVHLTASAAGIPTEAADSEIGGKFLGCRSIYVVSGSAGACTVAGRVVHELFHCAQALRVGATNSNGLGAARARWVVEGTAMWSMDRFGPTDDHEWRFFEDYAADNTGRPLDQLAHYSGMFFGFVDSEMGGPSRVLEIFDTMTSETNRSLLPSAFDGDAAKWHRFVNSSTGYEDLIDGSHGVQLVDRGGSVFPYQPTVGCTEDGSTQVGQEFLAPISVMSTAEAPVFDLDLPGPAARHEIVQVVDVATMQYLDVGMFGALGDAAAQGDPDLSVLALLVTQGGNNVVQDWSERWAAADGQAMEVPDFGTTVLSADTSFRICMTDDAPCQEASETFADLAEIRLVFSWAAVPASAGETLTGQLAIVPGAINGWTGKAYRRGTPDEEHDDESEGN